MKIEMRVVLAVAMVLAVASFGSAETTAQVGHLYVGTCDNALLNTQQNAIDVYDPAGAFVTTFRGPSQNSCLTGMTFDTGDNVHVIGARFGTQSWNLLEFDNGGNLLASPGPFTAPVSVAHDLNGNLYLAQGNVVKVDRAGNQTSYTVAGGAMSVDIAADQRTVFYTARNGDVKSFDTVSRTQGADLVPDALARQVRTLPGNSIMIDTLGAIQLWNPTCAGCPYKERITYQIPANADGFALDPDGVSFWTINTYFDTQHQTGNADVYRTNIKTGDPMGSFSLQPLANGRTYSMSIGVNGDGMAATATFTPASLAYPSRTVGVTSNPKKVVVTNAGIVQLVVNNVTITGDFAIRTNGCTKGVVAGGLCNISLTFTPTQIGTRTGTLKIFDNSANSPHTVTLSGVGK